MTRSVYRPVMCLDCANGVGALAMCELVKYLHAVDVKFVIYNDGSHGTLNHLVLACINLVFSSVDIIDVGSSTFI